LLTFDLAGGQDAGRAFVESVRIAQLASSLGGPETLVTHPASTTHVNLTPEELEAADIGPGTIRVSVGLEHPDDLVADFRQALDAI
jgi:methionine-gamma-lyase